jgi:hypothetical protein
MRTTEIDIITLQAEYKSFVTSATDKKEGVDLNKLINVLHSDGDWTITGAEALVGLAQQYGSFILKNALALAIAADIEDGELGL